MVVRRRDFQAGLAQGDGGMRLAGSIARGGEGAAIWRNGRSSDPPGGENGWARRRNRGVGWLVGRMRCRSDALEAASKALCVFVWQQGLK
jgi:hypothetical protein